MVLNKRTPYALEKFARCIGLENQDFGIYEYSAREFGVFKESDNELYLIEDGFESVDEAVVYIEVHYNFGMLQHKIVTNCKMSSLDKKDEDLVIGLINNSILNGDESGYVALTQDIDVEWSISAKASGDTSLQKRLLKAFVNLGFCESQIDAIANGELKPKAIAIDTLKAYVAGIFFSDSEKGSVDYDCFLDNGINCDLTVREPYADYNKSWIQEQMEASLDSLSSLLNINAQEYPKAMNISATDSFVFEGMLIFNATMDETNCFSVDPTLHYGEAYAEYIIAMKTIELNARLLEKGIAVTIEATSDFYDDVEKDDAYYGLLMYNAFLYKVLDEEEIKDSRTGVYCDIDEVVKEIEAFIGGILCKEFSDIYEYNENIVSKVFDHESQLGMLETFGDDYQKVIALNNINPKLLWSVVDGDDGKLHVTPGIKSNLNIVYHIATTKEWKSSDEDYLLY